MLIDQLKKRDGFTDSEAVLADFILNNPQAVLSMSMRDLSKIAFVSSPTVIRFCKKLGFSNFNDFKIRLSKETTEEYVRINSIDHNFPFEPSDSPGVLVSKMAGLSLAGIVNCRDTISVETLKNAAQLLSRYRCIDFYGIGQTITACQNFCEKMMRIGYITSPPESFDRQLYRARASGKDRIAFVVSYSGTQPICRNVISILKERETPVIVITGNPKSPLLPYAKYKFIIESKENLLVHDKMEYFSAIYMIAFLLDCLYAITFKLNFEANSKRIQENSNTDLYDDYWNK